MNMRLGKGLRPSFEREVQRLLEIANGEREQRATEILQSARRYWRFRRRKGRPPTRGSCLQAVHEQTKEARDLLGTWMESGRNYTEWKSRHRGLFEKVAATVADTNYILAPNLRGDPEDEPAVTRQYVLRRDWLRSLNAFEVHWFFLDLLQNPLRNDVRTCDRCGRWFLNRSGHRNKRFCKRQCAVLDAVTRSVRLRRHRDREQKLKLARSVIRDWTATKGANWKQWVSGRTGLSVKFLTRALNLGELKPPAGI